MNEVRIERFIQILKKKMLEKENIKNGIFALSTFYEFSKNKMNMNI